MDEPLIYTSKGNVPISSLQFSHSWEDTPDKITYVEEYRDDTGEIVKRGVAVYLKHGMLAQATANSFA